MIWEIYGHFGPPDTTICKDADLTSIEKIGESTNTTDRLINQIAAHTNLMKA
jgi:hypothetical protein